MSPDPYENSDFHIAYFQVVILQSTGFCSSGRHSDSPSGSVASGEAALSSNWAYGGARGNHGTSDSALTCFKSFPSFQETCCLPHFSDVKRKLRQSCSSEHNVIRSHSEAREGGTSACHPGLGDCHHASCWSSHPSSLCQLLLLPFCPHSAHQKKCC